MSSSVTWPGLDDFKRQLRELPRELAGEGANIVVGRANGAESTIKRSYPVRGGSLRDGMTTEHTRSQFGARSVVKNTDKEARVFELGSQARHTAIGANRGSMPANPIFSQTCRRERFRMYDDLKAMVERHGITVTGEG